MKPLGLISGGAMRERAAHPRARPRRRPGRAGLAVPAGIVLAAAYWWLHPPDPVAALAGHRAPLARVERVPAPDLGETIERWRLTDARGRSVRALWRPCRAGASPRWTVVMLGGLGTGDRAALLLPSGAPVNALAVDWPWSGSRRLAPWQIAVYAPRLQAALLRSPAALALGLEAAARQAEVDSTRLALAGASLGVPPALAALRLTRAPRALILVDGAAGLDTLLLLELRRVVRPPALAAPLAALAYRLVRPLEPRLNAGAAAGIPTLLISAVSDERLPRPAIEGLHAQLPHADVRWDARPHLRPMRRQGVEAVTREAVTWLERVHPEQEK